VYYLGSRGGFAGVEQKTQGKPPHGGFLLTSSGRREKTRMRVDTELPKVNKRTGGSRRTQFKEKASKKGQTAKRIHFNEHAGRSYRPCEHSKQCWVSKRFLYRGFNGTKTYSAMRKRRRNSTEQKSAQKARHQKNKKNLEGRESRVGWLGGEDALGRKRALEKQPQQEKGKTPMGKESGTSRTPAFEGDRCLHFTRGKERGEKNNRNQKKKGGVHAGGTACFEGKRTA